jgi:hypothetical protein
METTIILKNLIVKILPSVWALSWVRQLSARYAATAMGVASK